MLGNSQLCREPVLARGCPFDLLLCPPCPVTVCSACMITDHPCLLQGIIVYRGAYFGFYDTGKGVVFADEANAGFVARWAVAQAATAAANMIAYPFDTVRRRLMMQVRALPSIDTLVRECRSHEWCRRFPESTFSAHKGWRLSELRRTYLLRAFMWDISRLNAETVHPVLTDNLRRSILCVCCSRVPRSSTTRARWMHGRRSSGRRGAR